MSSSAADGGRGVGCGRAVNGEGKEEGAAAGPTGKGWTKAARLAVGAKQSKEDGCLMGRQGLYLPFGQRRHQRHGPGLKRLLDGLAPQRSWCCSSSCRECAPDAVCRASCWGQSGLLVCTVRDGTADRRPACSLALRAGVRCPYWALFWAGRQRAANTRHDHPPLAHRERAQSSY